MAWQQTSTPSSLTPPVEHNGGRKDKKLPLLTRNDVETMIAEGRHVIVVDQHVLRCDSWLKYHPGGDIAIKHMVGRDATDEVTAYVKVLSRTVKSLTMDC